MPEWTRTPSWSSTTSRSTTSSSSPSAAAWVSSSTRSARACARRRSTACPPPSPTCPISTRTTRCSPGTTGGRARAARHAPHHACRRPTDRDSGRLSARVQSCQEVSMSYEIRVEDVEYLRHGGAPLLRAPSPPPGAGPFPIIVELHGGAWCRSDRLADKGIHEPLAKSGVVVAALEWRQPPGGPYPASLQGIPYAHRWLQAGAEQAGGRA